MSFRICLLTLLLLSAPPLSAYRGGAPASSSGAPGQGSCWASTCHNAAGSSLVENSPAIKLLANCPDTYEPGVPQEMLLWVQDQEARVFGFQVSAWDSTGLPAGKFEPVDTFTQIIIGDGIEYLEHSLPRVDGKFRFRWIPPAVPAGPVTFYVAAVGANNNFNPTGDRVHLRSVTFNVGGPTVNPEILNGRVVNGASLTPEAGLAPATYATLFGPSGLTGCTVLWSDFFENAVAPKKLAGIRVLLQDLPTFIVAVVRGKDYGLPFDQVNFLVPDTVVSGQGVPVVVENVHGRSAPAIVSLNQRAPALFPFEPRGRRYIAAVQNDGSAYVGPANLFAGVQLDRPIRPARPGDIIQFFGTGFGPTEPRVPSGQIFLFQPGRPLPQIKGNVTVLVGGVPATVHYAGLAPNFVSLYQFTISVPDLNSGEYELLVEVDGVRTPALLLSVER